MFVAPFSVQRCSLREEPQAMGAHLSLSSRRSADEPETPQLRILPVGPFWIVKYLCRYERLYIISSHMQVMFITVGQAIVFRGLSFRASARISTLRKSYRHTPGG